MVSCIIPPPSFRFHHPANPNPNYGGGGGSPIVSTVRPTKSQKVEWIVDRPASPPQMRGVWSLWKYKGGELESWKAPSVRTAGTLPTLFQAKPDSQIVIDCHIKESSPSAPPTHTLTLALTNYSALRGWFSAVLPSLADESDTDLRSPSV